MSCRNSEYVTNYGGGGLALGTVVRFVGDNVILHAKGDNVDTLPAVGVTAAPFAPYDEGPIITCGKAVVRMASDTPTPAASDPLWVSATEAGRATTVAPAVSDVEPFFLGIIKDASGYTPNNPEVVADIAPGFCCWFLAMLPPR